MKVNWRCVLFLWAYACTSVAQENPFAAFFGVWTLKQDTFSQVWDKKTVETLTIANHLTHCDAVNTEKSVLCVVDAGGLKGHILWVYDGDKQQVSHLSHFGDARTGVGIGQLSESHDLTLQVRFQGEPEDTYRVYQYQWQNADEYTMLSTQYHDNGEPTGNWYCGTFVRLKP